MAGRKEGRRQIFALRLLWHFNEHHKEGVLQHSNLLGKKGYEEMDQMSQKY